MLDLIKNITINTVQGVLALGGFGVLSYMFVNGTVSADTYVPLVALMVGFFFNTARQGKPPEVPPQ